MNRDWWVTVVRAWPQENTKSRLVIRMVNSTAQSVDDQRFASIDEALDQLRIWLENLEEADPGGFNAAAVNDPSTEAPT